MKKPLLTFLFILTIGHSFSQATIYTELDGTFVEGLTGVNNLIEAYDPSGSSEFAEFYIEDPAYTVVYDTYLDSDPSDGFTWDLDMGTLANDAVISAAMFDAQGNFLYWSDTWQPTIVPTPHWLQNGTAVVNNIDYTNQDISFSVSYPIYTFPFTIPANIKGIGGRSIDISGKLNFDVTYNTATPNPVISNEQATVELNLLDQLPSYSQQIPLVTNSVMDSEFRLSVTAEDSIITPKVELNAPKIKFPVYPGVDVLIDAGISVHGVLKGKLVIGEDQGVWGFVDNGMEKTRISATLKGKAFLRGKVRVLYGAASATGSIKGDVRLGTAFDYTDVPNVTTSTQTAGDLKLSGEICYELLWGLAGSCKTSSNWYSDYFGDTTILRTPGSGQSNQLEWITFQDTATLVIPDFNPQPTFATRNDQLYGVWLEKVNDNGYLLFSKLNPATTEFTDVKVVVSNNKSITNPKVGILPSGSAIITWSQNRYDEVTFPIGGDDIDMIQAQDVWFAIYDNTTDDIVYMGLIDDDNSGLESGRAEGEASISVGTDNDAMITWIVADPIQGTSDVWFTHLVETANTWEISTPAVLSDLPGTNIQTKLSYIDNTSAIAVWMNDPDADEETDNSDLMYAVWDGTSWGSSAVLSANDGYTRLKELSLSANNGYIGFAWTSSITQTDGSFLNTLDMMTYNTSTQQWDMSSSFTDFDDQFYFQRPNVSISNTGKLSIAYQVIDMYPDTNYTPNGELYLYVKDLGVAGPWLEVMQNDFLCDTNTFIWELTTGFSANNNYYVMTQEYNDQGIVNIPFNGALFGDPELSMVLRGIHFGPNNTVSDIPEPGNLATGIVEKVNAPNFSFTNAFPNPFKDETLLEFQIRHAGSVQLELFDQFGIKIQELMDANLSPGIYKTVIKADALRNGVYFAKLTVDGRSMSKKLVLIK